MRWHSALGFALATHLNSYGVMVYVNSDGEVAKCSFKAVGKELELEVSERDVMECDSPREFLYGMVRKVVSELNLQRR